VIAAILAPNWWQAGLVIIGIVLFVARAAIRRSRLKRAQTEELLGEWEIYQRRQDR